MIDRLTLARQYQCVLVIESQVSPQRAHNTMSRIPYWLLAVLLVIGCSRETKRDNQVAVFVCELRVLKTLNPDRETSVRLASWSGESAHFLWAFKQKEQKQEGDYLIFQPDGFVLHTEPEPRRALIVQNKAGSAQVFRLSLERSAEAKDWTQWQRPDCVAKGAVGWSLIYNQKMDVVSADVPPDCFEMRYKIEVQNLGPRWDPSMKK